MDNKYDIKDVIALIIDSKNLVDILSILGRLCYINLTDLREILLNLDHFLPMLSIYVIIAVCLDQIAASF